MCEGYVAGHLRYKFIRESKGRMIETEDDEDECGDSQDNDHNKKNASINENFHDSDEHTSKKGKKSSNGSGKEIRNESDWYDCLAASPEGGLSISAAWTSSDIRVEVSDKYWFCFVLFSARPTSIFIPLRLLSIV